MLVIIKSKFVDLENLKKSNSALLDTVGNGWIGIDNYALLVDLPSDGSSRGYVTLNKMKIKKARETFKKLQEIAVPLKEIIK